MNGARTLVAWCPDWPLVAAGIPPAVPAAAFHANRVIACTAAARAEGVRRGLRRREAQARSPELVIERHDPARDARAFEPIVMAIETFTPRVEISRPGACALPTRGPSRYFGGDDGLAARIRDAVDAVLAGLPGAASAPEVQCRVGIADGPFAAALAARRGLVVPPGSTPAFLAPLPIGLLDEPELTDLLLRLGIRTLGALAALPPLDVTARFGPLGESAHARARGRDDRKLDCRQPPVDLTVQISLDPPADRVDTAAFAAKSLADELCRTLSANGMACTCIRIEAETEHGERLSRAWRHHRAFTPGAVAERVRWQLDGWLAARAGCGCSPGAGVACAGGGDCPNPTGGTTGGLTLLRLVPEEIGPDHGRQAGFWGGTTEADDRAARGLAHVQGILGPDGVVTAVLGGGRGPAEQVRLVPWGEPREPARPGPPDPTRPPGPTRSGPTDPARSRPVSRRPIRRTNAKPGTRVRTAGRSPSPRELPVWPGRLPNPFPAVVPRTPPPVDVVDRAGAPVEVTGRSLLTRSPTRMSIDGGPWTEITAWAGPWTADERWWDPDGCRRLARLQVVLNGGNAHLLLREGGRWWLEASYD
ncbi:MAG TPA: DNA polymerase Y family protein [Acidimicrobiales bacterium]